MLVRLGLILSLVMLSWSCSGSEDQPKEAVAADGKMPDAPGDGMKPAGEGAAASPEAAAAAAAAAAAPAPAPSAELAPPPAPTETAAQGGAGSLKVKVGKLNVRTGPGTKFKVARTLKKGDVVSPVSCAKSWCKLGEKEFVSKKFLSKAQ